MVSRNFFKVLWLTLTVSSASAAIDFTPAIREYTSNGLNYRQVTLRRDTGSITFVPPDKWEVRGGKDKLQLLPPDKSFVDATIAATTVAAPKPFDEATVKALEQQILAEAPPGSQPQVLSREENPIVMGQYLSLEIVISYRALGRTFQKSVIFVQAGDAQLIFRFTAPKEDFATLNSFFRRCILSWQWIEPSPSVKVAQKDGSQAVPSRQ
jgi:hypothetical protein